MEIECESIKVIASLLFAECCWVI